VHEEDDAPHAGAEIDEYVVRAHRGVAHHGQNFVDATRKVGDRPTWKVGGVGGDVFESEEGVDPRVALARGHGEESFEEHGAIVARGAAGGELDALAEW